VVLLSAANRFRMYRGNNSNNVSIVRYPICIINMGYILLLYQVKKVSPLGGYFLRVVIIIILCS